MNANVKKILAIGSVVFAGIMAMTEAFAEQRRDKDIEDLKKENKELHDRVSELEND